MCAAVINNKKVVIDMCQLSNPSPKLLKRFLTELNIQNKSLLALQFNYCRNAAVLEFKSSAVAAPYINKPLVYQGHPIPIYLEDNACEVRLLNIPLGVSNADVTTVMSKYGDVLSITNERWKNFFPGVPNGVKALKMVLKKPAPKSITVKNCIATVMANGKSINSRLNPRKSNGKVNKNNDKENNEDNKSNESTNSKNSNNTNVNRDEQQIENEHQEEKERAECNNNNAKTTKNHEQPIVETSSSSSSNNNNNNNYSDVKINDQSTSMDQEDEINEEEFQLVRSKKDRKRLKRAHSTEHEGKLHPDPEVLAGLSKQKRMEAAEKLLSEVTKKQDFYFQKWIEEKRDGSGDLLKEEEFKEKFLKYLNMRNEILDKKIEDTFNGDNDSDNE